MLNRDERTRIAFVATFVWSEWKRFCDKAQGDSWKHREARQAYVDSLQAFKVSRLIEDYDLDTGVCINGEWHKKIPDLPRPRKSRKPTKKPYGNQEPKRFEVRHLHFNKVKPLEFSELDAPDWLTSINTIPGSTMDNRWFWEKHVLTLSVGDSVDTDFHRITRIL